MTDKGVKIDCTMRLTTMQIERHLNNREVGTCQDKEAFLPQSPFEQSV